MRFSLSKAIENQILQGYGYGNKKEKSQDVAGIKSNTLNMATNLNMPDRNLSKTIHMLKTDFDNNKENFKPKNHTIDFYLEKNKKHKKKRCCLCTIK